MSTTTGDVLDTAALTDAYLDDEPTGIESYPLPKPYRGMMPPQGANNGRFGRFLHDDIPLPTEAINPADVKRINLRRESPGGLLGEYYAYRAATLGTTSEASDTPSAPSPSGAVMVEMVVIEMVTSSPSGVVVIEMIEMVMSSPSGVVVIEMVMIEEVVVRSSRPTLGDPVHDLPYGFPFPGDPVGWEHPLHI